MIDHIPLEVSSRLIDQFDGRRKYHSAPRSLTTWHMAAMDATNGNSANNNWYMPRVPNGNVFDTRREHLDLFAKKAA